MTTFHSRRGERHRFRRVLLCLLVGAFIVASALGQAGHGKGRLKGLVLDEDGNPIPAAKIVLRFVRSLAESPRGVGAQVTESAVFETVTGKKGTWMYSGLATGIWDVRASMDNYDPASLEVRVSQLADNPVVTLRLEGLRDRAMKLLDQANALFWQKKFGEALPFFKQYLELDPEDVMTMLTVGDCLRGSGNFEGTILQFQAVVDITSPDPLSKEITSLALTGIGETYFKKGDRPNTVKYFKLALEASPTNEVIAANLGELLFSDGKPDEAIRYYEIAVNLAPANPDFLYKLGFIYLNKGDYARARPCFTKVIELLPGSALSEKADQILRELDQKKAGL